MQSLININSFNKYDTAVQMARCSFDIHVQEILGILTIGASLVMLHRQGTIDLDYLAGVLHKTEITYMHAVPSLLCQLFTFVEQIKNRDILKCLRSISSIGESLKTRRSHVSRPHFDFRR